MTHRRRHGVVRQRRGSYTVRPALGLSSGLMRMTSHATAGGSEATCSGRAESNPRLRQPPAPTHRGPRAAPGRLRVCIRAAKAKTELPPAAWPRAMPLCPPGPPTDAHTGEDLVTDGISNSAYLAPCHHVLHLSVTCLPPHVPTESRFLHHMMLALSNTQCCCMPTARAGPAALPARRAEESMLSVSCPLAIACLPHLKSPTVLPRRTCCPASRGELRSFLLVHCPSA